MKNVFKRILSILLITSLLSSITIYKNPAKAASIGSGVLFDQSGTYIPQVSGVYRIVAVGRGGNGRIHVSEDTNTANYYHGGAGGAGYVDVFLEAGVAYPITIDAAGNASFAELIAATPGRTEFYQSRGMAGSVSGVGVVPFPSNDTRTGTIQPPDGMWQDRRSSGGRGYKAGGGGIFGGNGTDAGSTVSPTNGAGKGGMRTIGEIRLGTGWAPLPYNLEGGGGGGGYGGAAGLAAEIHIYHNSMRVVEGEHGTPGGACVYIDESALVTYQVEHYTQNAENDNFTFMEQETMVGIAGSAATPNAKSYTGFSRHEIPPVIVNDGTVVKIYYYRSTFNVTYDSNGGSSVVAQTVRYGAAAPTQAPSRVGYNFGGWHTDATLTSAYGGAGVVGDMTLYANWTPREDTRYQVQHFQQDVSGAGYTLHETDDLTGTTDTAVTAVAKTYTGFTRATEHPEQVSSGTVAPDGSLVLRLHYDRDLHSVTFDSKGGSSVPSQTGIRFEGTATEPPPPARQGYTFGGWRADEGGTIVFSFETPITSDVTTYAAWDARTDTPYKVEHYRQEVTSNDYVLWGTEELTGTTDTTVTAMAKPFTGFNEVATHPDRVATGSIAPDGSLLLRLFYDRNLHSVTFDTRGGSSVAEQTGIRFEGTATEPTPPSKQGYDFGSWWADEGCTISFDFTAPITADVTVYASWTARDDTPYRVEHYQQDVIGDGYTLRDTDSLVGTTDATVTALDKSYTGFHEVTTHPDGVADGSIAPDGSLVLKLYYDRDVHSVTFDTRSGSSVPSQTGIRFESTASEPTPPTKQGYDFGGWWADEDCTIAFSFATPITVDVTAYASWLPRTFLVTLDPNGGEVSPTSILLVYGQLYGDLPDAVKDDSTFVGWYSLPDGGAKVTESAIMNQAENTTLYAQWASSQTGIVDGEVRDPDGDPLPGVKITLRAGAVNYKSAITDDQGRFTITGVRYGTYNLVAEKDAKIVTTLFEMNNSQVTRVIILPLGKTNSVVVVEENSPEIVAGGLDDLFGHDKVYTESDAAVVDGGGKVELRLTIAMTTTENAGDDGQKLTRGVTKPINMLLDMTITKEVYLFGADYPTSVKILEELPELMTIIIPLSEAQKGNSGYTVYRIHAGEVNEIRQAPNEDGEYISVQDDRILLYARKFSLYALVHDAPRIMGKSHIITATSGPGGTISPEGQVTVAKGESKTFTISPKDGHKIADVLVDGKSIGAVTNYKFSEVTMHHTIEAVFYCPSQEYHDIDPDKWYHAAVDYVIEHGYMTGVAKNRWAPEEVITRAEFVAVLARLDGSGYPGALSTYMDVSETAWYAPDVAWGQERGVGYGYDKYKFGPGDELTREQMVLMLYRYANVESPGSSGILTVYSDSGRISLWSTNATIWAANSGLLQGSKKGLLNPRGAITRAEVAAVLMRFLGDL